MLPYYVLKKTEEDKEFYFSHKGFFNFFDKYLILNLGYDNHLVLVNRTGRKFHGKASAEEMMVYELVVDIHVEARLPEEMFKDFPELDRRMIWRY